MRTLLDGSTVTELKDPKTLKVYTKCPEKWKLIDMETGEEYVGYVTQGSSDWKKVKDARH